MTGVGIDGMPAAQKAVLVPCVVREQELVGIAVGGQRIENRAGGGAQRHSAQTGAAVGQADGDPLGPSGLTLVRARSSPLEPACRRSGRRRPRGSCRCRDRDWSRAASAPFIGAEQHRAGSRAPGWPRRFAPSWRHRSPAATSLRPEGPQWDVLRRRSDEDCFRVCHDCHSRSSCQRSPDGCFPPFPQRSPPRPLDRSSLRWFGTLVLQPEPEGPSLISCAARCFKSVLLRHQNPLSAPSWSTAACTMEQAIRVGGAITGGDRPPKS